ncbi:hypothetical protein AX16_007714 [Volvariella volvacea WC 439]|nr:hypothetical protein AX16_007714 [Volvariella volvacea WC 439]
MAPEWLIGLKRKSQSFASARKSNAAPVSPPRNVVSPTPRPSSSKPSTPPRNTASTSPSPTHQTKSSLVIAAPIQDPISQARIAESVAQNGAHGTSVPLIFTESGRAVSIDNQDGGYTSAHEDSGGRSRSSTKGNSSRPNGKGTLIPEPVFRVTVDPRRWGHSRTTNGGGKGESNLREMGSKNGLASTITVASRRSMIQVETNLQSPSSIPQPNRTMRTSQSQPQLSPTKQKQNSYPPTPSTPSSSQHSSISSSGSSLASRAASPAGLRLPPIAELDQFSQFGVVPAPNSVTHSNTSYESRRQNEDGLFLLPNPYSQLGHEQERGNLSSKSHSQSLSPSPSHHKLHSISQTSVTSVTSTEVSLRRNSGILATPPNNVGRELNLDFGLSGEDFRRSIISSSQFGWDSERDSMTISRETSTSTLSPGDFRITSVPGRITGHGSLDWDSIDNEALNEQIEKIMRGVEVVVSHVGSSQYEDGIGVSACGLAALNCVRIVLGKEQDGVTGERLVMEMMKRQAVEDILSICRLWNNDAHLEVDEIYNIPLFKSSIELRATMFGRPCRDEFITLLSALQNTSNRSTVAVITRPPEIICCFKIPTSRHNIFFAFDSHPRPLYPQGAGLIFTNSLDDMAHRLDSILHVDSHLLKDSSMDWQTQLLNNYSGHIFIARDTTMTLREAKQTILELSLSSLSYKTQENELKQLRAEKQRLENAMKGSQERRTTLIAQVDALTDMNQQLLSKVHQGDQAASVISSLKEQFEALQREYRMRENLRTSETENQLAVIESLRQELKRVKAELANSFVLPSPATREPSRRERKGSLSDTAKPPTRKHQHQHQHASGGRLKGSSSKGSSRSATPMQSTTSLNTVEAATDSSNSASNSSNSHTKAEQNPRKPIRLRVVTAGPSPSNSTTTGSQPTPMTRVASQSGAVTPRLTIRPSYSGLQKERPQTVFNISPPSATREKEKEKEKGKGQEKEKEKAKAEKGKEREKTGEDAKGSDGATPRVASRTRTVSAQRATPVPHSIQQTQPRARIASTSKATLTSVSERRDKALPPTPVDRPTSRATITSPRRERTTSTPASLRMRTSMVIDPPQAAQAQGERTEKSDQDTGKEGQKEKVASDGSTRERKEQNGSRKPTKLRSEDKKKESVPASSVKRPASAAQRPIDTSRRAGATSATGVRVRVASTPTLLSPVKSSATKTDKKEGTNAHKKPEATVNEAGPKRVEGTKPSTFDCAVCFDEHPLHDIARVDGCDHLFCRDCLRKYVVSKIEERRFPIMCAVCAVKDVKDPGMITENLVQVLGISEANYSTFVELQMVGISINVQCRKCNRSSFIDKGDYEAITIIACPLPGCNYVWCKLCHQEVNPRAQSHSCDGNRELKELVRREGWKQCPGCTSTVQKIEGCNHMTCVTPGCNTHFCYVCGALLYQGQKRSEIDKAVERHFGANCGLFYVPPE